MNPNSTYGILDGFESFWSLGISWIKSFFSSTNSMHITCQSYVCIRKRICPIANNNNINNNNNNNNKLEF